MMYSAYRMHNKINTVIQYLFECYNRYPGVQLECFLNPSVFQASQQVISLLLFYTRDC